MSDAGDAGRAAADRALLDELLPEARRMAAEAGPPTIASSSAIGRAAAAHHRIERVVGVRVHRQPGGWAADVHFDGLPIGVPRVIGTPTARPMATEAGARDRAVEILASLVASAPAPADEGIAVFAFHDIVVRMPRDALADVAARGGAQTNPEAVAEALALVDAALGVRTAEDLGRLDEDGMTILRLAAMGAMLASIPRWPLPAAPEGVA